MWFCDDASVRREGRGGGGLAHFEYGQTSHSLSSSSAWDGGKRAELEIAPAAFLETGEYAAAVREPTSQPGKRRDFSPEIAVASSTQFH